MFRELGFGVYLDYEDRMSQQVDKTVQSMNKLMGTAQTMEREVSKSLYNMQNVIIAGYAFNTIGTSFERMGNSVVRTVKNIGKSIVDTGKTMETYRKSMSVFFKDYEDKINWGIKFAAKTPFEINQTLDALKSLKAAGIDATTQFKNANGELKPFLQYVGDLAALKPELGMENVFIAIRNLIGGNSRSFEQRLDLKPKLILGRDIDKSSVQSIMNDIVAISQKVAPNLMGSLEGTYEQVASNIKDIFTMIKKTIADKGIFDEVKNTLNYIYSALYKMDIDRFADTVAKSFKMIWTPVDFVVRRVTDLVIGIEKLTEKAPFLGKLVVGFTTLSGALLSVSGVMMKLVGNYFMFASSIISMLASLALLKHEGISFGVYFAKAGSMVSKAFNGIGLVALSLYAVWRFNLGGIRDFTERTVKNLSDAWRMAGDMIEGSYSSRLEKLNGITGEVDTNMEKLAMRLAQVKLFFDATFSSLFGQKDGEFVLFSEDKINAFKRAGLYEYVVKLVMLRERVTAFFGGFTKGLDRVVAIGKNAINFVFTPIRAMLDVFTAGNFSKMLGLSSGKTPDGGEKKINQLAKDNLDIYKKQIETMQQLGKVAGVVISTFLGFKLVNGIMNGFHKNTKNITQDLQGENSSSGRSNKFSYLSREATRIPPLGKRFNGKYSRVDFKNIDYGNPDSHFRDWLMNNANVDPKDLVVKRKPEFLRRLFGDTYYEMMFKEDSWKKYFPGHTGETITPEMLSSYDMSKVDPRDINFQKKGRWGGLFGRQRMANIIKHDVQNRFKGSNVFTPGGTAEDRLNAPYLDREIGVATPYFLDFINKNKMKSVAFDTRDSNVAQDKSLRKTLGLGRGKKPFINTMEGFNTGFAYNFDPTKMFVNDDVIKKEQESAKEGFINSIGKNAIEDMFNQDYFLKQVGLDEKEIKKLRAMQGKGKYNVHEDTKLKGLLGEWLWGMSTGYNEEVLEKMKMNGEHINPYVAKYLRLEKERQNGKAIFEESRKINPNSSRWSKFKNTMGKTQDLLFGKKLYYLEDRIDPVTGLETGEYEKRYIGRKAGLFRPQQENVKWGEYKTVGQKIRGVFDKGRVKMADFKDSVSEALTPYRENFIEPMKKSVSSTFSGIFIDAPKALLGGLGKLGSKITPNYVKGVFKNFKNIGKFLEESGFKKPKLFSWGKDEETEGKSFLSKVGGFGKKIGGGVMKGIQGTFGVGKAMFRTLLPIASIGVGLGQMLWQAGGGSIDGVRKKTEQWLNFMKNGGSKKLKDMWTSFKTNGSAIFNNLRETGKLFWGFLKTDGIKILKEAIQGLKGMFLGFGDWFSNGGYKVLGKLLLNIGIFAGKAIKFLLFDFMPRIVTGIFKALSDLATSILKKIPIIGKLFGGGGKSEVSATTPDGKTEKLSLNFREPKHHGGLFLSPMEHSAIIRKDETVLPPNISRGFANIIQNMETQNAVAQKAPTLSKEKIAPQIKEGDITIQKVEIIIKTDNIGDNMQKVSRQLANEFLKELKKIKKEKSLKSYGKVSIDTIIDSM